MTAEADSAILWGDEIPGMVLNGSGLLLKKIAGSLLMLSASAGLGLHSAVSLRRRENTLEEILQMLLLLKGEIRYGRITLKEACLDAAERLDGPCKRFLEALAAGICEEGFGEWFAQCAERELKPCGLTEKELRPLCLLGNRLGYLDTDMQLRQLELCGESLGQILSCLRKELPQKQKLYRSLGILGGLMLVILLW